MKLILAKSVDLNWNPVNVVARDNVVGSGSILMIGSNGLMDNYPYSLD
jgi:hypothetical protein